MALIKNQTPGNIQPTVNPAVVQAAVTDAPWEEVHVETATTVDYATAAAAQAPVEQPASPQAVYAQAHVQQSHMPAVAQANTAIAVSAPAGLDNAMIALANQGFEGLKLDWTSFPAISLKNEGVFEDIDGNNYGKDFTCRVQQSKTRYVYRAVPVLDNKRDVAYSYDRIQTQNGILIKDKKREWAAQGKTVEEKEYLELLVEMDAPGESYDGESRILQISPTSVGRISGQIRKAAMVGGGNPSNVIMRFMVGAKLTKVQNPYYPWTAEVVKG